MLKGFARELFSWLKAIIIALVIVFVVREFLMTPSIVKGESMYPTLQDGDRIMISKVTPINRFDEIAFHAPDTDENYVKRVIGLPGDSIEMKDDMLYINGKAYQEEYLTDKKQTAVNNYFTENFTLEEITGETVVPDGYLFVLGDNRPVSRDSRRFGFVKEDSVIGDVVFRIWPLDAIGIPK
ncbi:Signal peptidase IB [Paraliobacillus sp. PM-2]|uniref:signal peptidase I n=1 Tax=Paraliobacillus sp. PM-2 TaxID=1462524 RepID=UPI00061C5887|nr:signal peptidase I [Paraliobacillus sp. PM-2]CQR48344.1 Signal peptidase IB [Paraliobacillus sp. PM-2]